jgi:AmiR/NasT family two-component response regulator
VVGHAKGILMEKRGFSEKDVFRMLDGVVPRAARLRD